MLIPADEKQHRHDGRFAVVVRESDFLPPALPAEGLRSHSCERRREIKKTD
jgi:hypothetical protein